MGMFGFPAAHFDEIADVAVLGEVKFNISFR